MSIKIYGVPLIRTLDIFFFPFPFVLPVYPVAKYFLFNLINKLFVPIQLPLLSAGTVFPSCQNEYAPLPKEYDP